MEEELTKEKTDPAAKQEDDIYINKIFSIHEEPKKMSFGLEIVYKDIHGDLEEKRVNKKIYQDKKEGVNIIIDTEKIKNSSSSDSQESDKENDKRIGTNGNNDDGQKNIAGEIPKVDSIIDIVMKKLDENTKFISKRFEDGVLLFNKQINGLKDTVKLMGEKVTKLEESNISLQKGFEELSNSLNPKVTTLETSLSKVETYLGLEINKFGGKVTHLEAGYSTLKKLKEAEGDHSKKVQEIVDPCINLIKGLDYKIQVLEKKNFDDSKILRDFKDDNEMFKKTFINLKNNLPSNLQSCLFDQSINKGNPNPKEASQGKN